MYRKWKKYGMVFLGVMLIPYIITVGFHGKEVNSNQNHIKNYLELETETGTVQIELQEYAIGRLASEVTSEYEEEMIKAQAVLVRTTLYQEIEDAEGGRIEAQVYKKKEEMKESWYQYLKTIWEATDGMVVWYDNQLAFVPYHQVSNGKTRDAKEVLGTNQYPYLTAKECPKDKESELYFKSIVLPISEIEILEKDSSGYVLSLKAGEETCSGENFRYAYGLASSSFEIQKTENELRVVTQGVGHGLGMSQYTANAMAKDGASYQTILEYFFEKTELKEVAEILLSTE